MGGFGQRAPTFTTFGIYYLKTISNKDKHGHFSMTLGKLLMHHFNGTLDFVLGPYYDFIKQACICDTGPFQFFTVTDNGIMNVLSYVKL